MKRIILVGSIVLVMSSSVFAAKRMRVRYVPRTTSNYVVRGSSYYTPYRAQLNRDREFAYQVERYNLTRPRKTRRRNYVHNNNPPNQVYGPAPKHEYKRHEYKRH